MLTVNVQDLPVLNTIKNLKCEIVELSFWLIWLMECIFRRSTFKTFQTFETHGTLEHFEVLNRFKIYIFFLA